MSPSPSQFMESDVIPSVDSQVLIKGCKCDGNATVSSSASLCVIVLPSQSAYFPPRQASLHPEKSLLRSVGSLSKPYSGNWCRYVTPHPFPRDHGTPSTVLAVSQNHHFPSHSFPSFEPFIIPARLDRPSFAYPSFNDQPPLTPGSFRQRQRGRAAMRHITHHTTFDRPPPYTFPVHSLHIHPSSASHRQTRLKITVGSEW